MLSPGTCLGTAAMLRGGAAAALVGTCAFALAVTSLLLRGMQVVFGTAGEAARELGVGLRVCGADIGTLIGVSAGLGTTLTLLAASRRRREAGEPGRRCVWQERWLAPDGGRASLEMGTRAGAVTGRGTNEEVGEVEGLGNLEDGSGQTGLLGWAAGPRRDGLRFTLEAELESGGVGDGAADGVRALRGTCVPCNPPGLGDCLEELPTGVEGREEEPLLVTGRGSWVGFLSEGDTPWRFFLGAAIEPFLDRVGVHAGEGVYDRHACPAVFTGLQVELEEEEDDEVEEEEDEDEMRLSTAARGSMSGGGGGAALQC